MKCQLMIPAAGSGSRLGADRPKALVEVGGKPLLACTLERFAPIGLLTGAIILYPEGCLDAFRDALHAVFPAGTFLFTPGGAERQASVRNGLECLDPGTEIVVIHDAARPFISPESIQASIDAAGQYGAATVAIPSVDTILEGDEDAFLVNTPDRSRLWACQTPQTFRVDVIREAHRRAEAEGYAGTDDATLVRRMGGKVKFVLGHPLNIKVTTPSDLALAELIQAGGWRLEAGGSPVADCGLRIADCALSETRNSQPRIRNSEPPASSLQPPASLPRAGLGYDIHRLVEGRPLILGGVTIPFLKGLDGHSDADVLVHAIADALLGAAAQGNIGRHFPDTDSQYKNANSLDLLKKTYDSVKAAGYTLVNIDANVIAQQPKLNPHVDAMRRNIAECLGVSIDLVSIKPRTKEGLGPEGMGEAVSAHAILVIRPAQRAGDLSTG